MTTETSAPTAPSSHVQGLRCRRCGQPQPIGPSFVCPACFGPLEVVYDLAAARAALDAPTIAARPAGIWRYLELLPVDAPPARALAVGGTALVRADRLAAALGVRTVWLKDDSRNPTLSFKDRVVAMAAARAVEFGFDTLACASTGNLAGATAAAAAVAGLRSVVFIPADLEPAKVAHALAYGATVVPVQGTYDQVNRLSLEVAGEVPWAFVNVNLRPYYAEGSKTLAFEIAEELGWRLPDVIVAPLASGSLYVKTGKAVHELIEVGLVESRPVRFIGGQPDGCAPIARAFGAGSSVIEPVRQPDTIVKSLAIGDPADGPYALELARESGGSLESVPDSGHGRGHPPRGGDRGHLHRDGRRRDGGRPAAGHRPGRRPTDRRGRRPAHGQRPQDARRAVLRAAGRGPWRRPIGPADPARRARPGGPAGGFDERLRGLVRGLARALEAGRDAVDRQLHQPPDPFGVSDPCRRCAAGPGGPAAAPRGPPRRGCAARWPDAGRARPRAAATRP